ERFPFPYSDEVWTGIEYSTAALLAYRGLVDEALAIVKAARDRHDGTRRNPWDEFECGHHYARSMSSYAVLLALSGFAADLPRERLAFAPRINERDFATFFSVDSGWGLYSQKLRAAGSEHVLDARCGSVRIRTLSLPCLGRKKPGKARATLAGRPLKAAAARTEKGMDVVLQRTVTVRPGRVLRVECLMTNV
ncbi:MAG: GH116 family glycosyl hydrolase, partial [Candidatus Brocadiia bacterium]|nr:GH116 family glycosyl hydrolase [Candidatus Brocadiia bacterium]